jgi:hypothetical protein
MTCEIIHVQGEASGHHEINHFAILFEGRWPAGLNR